MKFVDDWGHVLREAWSVKFAIIGALLGGMELALPLFSDAVPRGVFAVLMIAVSVLGALARLVKQPKLHDPTRRDRQSGKQRIAMAALVLSFAGGVAILTREGYTDEAVIPTKGDVPTVGFGSTTGVKMGDTTTPVRALQRAATELDSTYEAAVKRCVKVPLHQAEYDVYVSMAYNIGTAGFCGSSIAARANAGDYRGACDAILMWKNAAGYDCSTTINGAPNKRCWGLWQDRLKDHARCVAAQ